MERRACDPSWPPAIASPVIIDFNYLFEKLNLNGTLGKIDHSINFYLMKNKFWKKALITGIISWIALNLFFAFRLLGRLKKLKERYNTHIIQEDKKISYAGKEFSGDSVLIAFGALEMNLEKAIPAAQSMKLDLYANYCGVKIIVPKNWNIEAEGHSFLGGISNATRKKKEPEFPTLYIKYNISFAGLEVVND
ncbi:hypothetical protein BH23BAC1_BH23BAC1_43290 [soil metagenome]